MAQATFQNLQQFQSNIIAKARSGNFDGAYKLLYSKTNNSDYADTCLRCLYFVHINKILYKTPAEKEAIKKRNQKSKEDLKKLRENIQNLKKLNEKSKAARKSANQAIKELQKNTFEKKHNDSADKLTGVWYDSNPASGAEYTLKIINNKLMLFYNYIKNYTKCFHIKKERNGGDVHEKKTRCSLHSYRSAQLKRLMK